MVSTIPIPFVIVFCTCWLKVGTALIQLEPSSNQLVALNEHQTPDKALIPKVSLTQKGYIQVCFNI